MESDEQRISIAKQKYLENMHAVQTGVMYVMEQGGKETTPKHLRVGVNSALMDSAALATLLMRKELITEVEYYEVLAEFSELEKASYEDRVNRLFGADGRIKLG